MPTSAAKEPDNSNHMGTSIGPDTHKQTHTHTVTQLLAVNQLHCTTTIPPKRSEELGLGEEGVVHMCDALAVISAIPPSFGDPEIRQN